MAIIGATDFKYGLDRRRPRVAGAPGTCWDAQNCHITRGGDIESMRAFVPVYILPTGCFGLAQAAGQLYTFGSANIASTVPVGVQYVQCVPEGGTANMIRVLHAKAFQGHVYVIAEYDDGNIRHYYNGARVTDWDTLADANSTVITLATYLAAKLSADSTVSVAASGSAVIVTANIAGVPFTLSAAVTGSGSVTVATPQPNVVAVTEDQATATVTISGGSSNPGVNRVSQITAGGVPLMAAPVDWALSDEATAASVAAAINANAAINGGYTAAEASGVISIDAPPGEGALANGIVVTATANGVSAVATNFAGGVSAQTAVPQVSTVTLGGTFVTTDFYTITLNSILYAATGRASGVGTSIFVYKQRIYSPANTLLQYSTLNDATNWHNVNPASGSGFIDFSTLVDGSQRLSGMAVYSGYVAIFLPKSILIYNLAADATTVSLVQLLPNTGTVAGLSALQYGLNSFYLDSTGVRSVQARDISNIAITSDIGTVLDPFIQSWVASVGAGAVLQAEAVIEPFDARYWLAIGTRIFVLSLFTTAQVSAWSYYDIGLVFHSFTTVYNSRLYCLAGNTVYLYGGPGGNVYPAPNQAPITVALPFISGGSPANFKQWGSFDFASIGAWTVTFLPDPDNEQNEIQYGTAINTTYTASMNATVGRTSLVAIRFNCSTGGHVTLSSFSASYESVGDK